MTVTVMIGFSLTKLSRLLRTIPTMPTMNAPSRLTLPTDACTKPSRFSRGGESLYPPSVPRPGFVIGIVFAASPALNTVGTVKSLAVGTRPVWLPAKSEAPLAAGVAGRPGCGSSSCCVGAPILVGSNGRCPARPRSSAPT